MNEVETNQSLKLKINMDEEIFCGQKMNVGIISESKFDIILNDLNIDVLINKDMFKFIKKNFQSDVFKVRVEKLDNNIIKINFKLKKQVNLNKNQEYKLINFNLNVKKKVLINESDIIFKIKLNENENEKEFIKHILVDNNLKKDNICKIKNISIKSDIEDQKIKFDKDIKDYKIIVPHDQQYIDIELCESFDNLENVKSKCIKLKREGSSTLVKAGDYKIEVYRLDNPEKSKDSKKFNNSKELKKTTKNYKDKNKRSEIKNLKDENLNNKIKEILGHNNSEINIADKSKEQDNNNVSYIKEEKINIENKNNLKNVVILCTISLTLIGLFGFLWKKRKNKS